MERRTRASGVRKGSNLNSWIWCMLIKVFCLPCIFSECAGANISVSVYPIEDRRILYGQPLDILCMAEQGYVAEDLELSFAGTLQNTTIVNGTTIKLHLELPKKSVYTFICKNKRTNQVCTSRAVVDVAPPNVTMFKCLSRNLDQLNCTWWGPRTEHVINYTLTFLVNNNLVMPCKVVKEANLSWCTWYADSGSPLYRQQLDYYHFRLTSCNTYGCNVQNFTVDHFSIVKPDKPYKLEVIHQESHKVTMKWVIPNNIADLLAGGVDHRIEYQIAEIDDNAQFHAVDATDLPANNKTYRFTLELPYAYKVYEVRIYIRPKKAKGEEFWSDYAYIFVNTTSETPRRPPDIGAGSFHQKAYDNYRFINVYWSQLWEYEEAGANFTYKVVVLQGNKSETLFPENKSLSFLSLKNASTDSLQVTVWSQNAVGTSENASHLYIPPKAETDTLTLKSFTKLIHENGTYELSWNKMDNINNYTLFWCELNTTKTCTGHMNFTTLLPNVSKHSIDLPKPNVYQFAISANNGTRSSGMTWANCDIPRGQLGLYAYHVTLRHDIVGTTFVTLKWNIDCVFPEGFLKGYNIFYCPSIDISTSCEKNKNETVYIYDPEQKSAKVENLLPYRTYQFSIALNTSYGVAIQNITDSVTTLEDTPTKPLNLRVDYVTHESVNISWEAPIPPNGKISSYNIIKKQGVVQQKFDVEGNVFQYHLTGLQSLTNYTFFVQACNFNARKRCSNLSDEVFVRTRIGPPAKMSAPSFNNTMNTIEWVPPGPVDLYQVKILRDGEEVDTYNTTELAIKALRCEGAVESYQVRGINFDSDLYHGALGDPMRVNLPKREKEGDDEYISEWSEKYTMPCSGSGGLTLTLIIMAVFTLVGVAYGSLKLYKKLKQMEDIKPVFPNGLSVPEKELNKYGFGGWNQINKDEKPSSDEMLLLPNSKTTVSPTAPGGKQSDIDNCDASDHTDSTALSNNSQGPVDRQSSLSDNGSESSLHLEIEQDGNIEKSDRKDEEASTTESESSRGNSPYLNDQAFKKNPTSGYVQSVISPNAVVNQAAPAPFKSPPHEAASLAPAAGSSYVMAGLSPGIFTTGVAPTRVSPVPASGYVRAEDVQARSMNFPKLGPSPTKALGPESLPPMPTLPPPSKLDDSSYIQLQSLDALPRAKGAPGAAPRASRGYVSPGDAVISKHLSNMLARAPDTPAVLDPDMSPDAYCRFSWTTDPAIDNFNSILVDSSTLNSPKN